jgi:hypothetical protein
MGEAAVRLTIISDVDESPCKQLSVVVQGRRGLETGLVRLELSKKSLIPTWIRLSILMDGKKKLTTVCYRSTYSRSTLLPEKRIQFSGHATLPPRRRIEGSVIP